MSDIRGIATFISDGDWIESQDQSDYGIRLIQTGNIGNGEYLDKPDKAKYISEEIYYKLHCTDVHAGDILISRLPDPIGRSCIVPKTIGRAVTAVDCTILRINTNIYNPQFFVYYTQTDIYKSKLSHFLTGTTRKRISRKNLEKIVVPQYSRESQDDVVKKLDKITNLISMRKQQVEILDELVKSRFLERFGEPGVNDKEFPCYPVGQIAESVTYGTSAPASNSGQYEYLRMNNLTDNGQLDLSDLKRIDMSDEQAEKYMVKKGDILFNRTNSIDLVGKTALFNLNTPMIIAGYLIRIRLSDKVNPVYFTAYMNMPYMKEKLRNMAKGAVNQANINSKELKSIQILIPPLSLQNEYCNFVLSIDKSKMAVQKSLDELETLKKSLMQTYFG